MQPVVQTLRRDSGALVELRVGTDTVRATPEHPFWVAGQGWKVAGELVAGDALLRSDGQAMPVLEVSHHTDESTPVYNVEVVHLTVAFWAVLNQPFAGRHSTSGKTRILGKQPFTRSLRL